MPTMTQGRGAPADVQTFAPALVLQGRLQSIRTRLLQRNETEDMQAELTNAISLQLDAGRQSEARLAVLALERWLGWQDAVGALNVELQRAQAQRKASSERHQAAARHARVTNDDLLALDGFFAARIAECPDQARKRLVSDAAHSFKKSVPAIERWIRCATKRELLRLCVMEKVARRAFAQIHSH
jgi:hypothetical protein